MSIRQRRAWRAACLTTSLAILPALLSAQTRAAAPARAAGAWSRVPAFPAGCYAGADDFGSRLASSIAATEADRESHAERKAALSERMRAIDPMEQARRMQAYMMQNPTEAAAAMQAVQATGADAADAYGGDYYRGQEFARFAPNFKEALAAAIAPTEAAIAAHVKAKATWDQGGFTFWFTAPADEARLLSLVAQQNADYERLCAAWLTGNGTIPRWMRTYRTYLTDELVPRLEAADQAGMMQVRIILGPEMGDYSSRESLDAVLDYLKKATEMNGLRRTSRYAPPNGFTKKH
jgi:hypothetical protein